MVASQAPAHALYGGVVPELAARMHLERIAGVVAFAIDLPDDTVVNEFTVGPANQPW